jgi:hypothetical protein
MGFEYGSALLAYDAIGLFPTISLMLFDSFLCFSGEKWLAEAFLILISSMLSIWDVSGR